MTPIYVLGTGAVGLPLAAYLVHAGRKVVALRTRQEVIPLESVPVTVRSGGDVLTVPVPIASLSSTSKLDGVVAVTVKSYANYALAATLAGKEVTGPIVVMQNGLSVETPFAEFLSAPVCRCVLYMSSQVENGHDVTFRQITSSPIGMASGPDTALEACVRALTTPQFSFHADVHVQREVWKKTIINAVFNSLCPLLEIDNGIFVRDHEVAGLAAEIIGECVPLAKASGLSLTEAEVMDQALKISRGSQGVLISTLQDLRHGRETEIESLNLAMARLATTLHIPLPKTEFLGRLILAKSRGQARNSTPIIRGGAPFYLSPPIS